MIIEINKREYELSKRKARQVIVLQEEAQKLDMPEQGKNISADNLKNLLVVKARAICDSLEKTYSGFNWFEKAHFLRYKKFIGKKGVYNLLGSLAPDDLLTYYNKLMELEGAPKKKAQEKGKLSGEKSPKV